MKKLKCTVVGKFAYGFNVLDGQTVKCDMIYKELTEYFGKNKISYVDTYNWKKNKIKMIKNAYKAIKNSDNIIIMPAHNGIKVFAPLFIILNLIFKKRLHYVVIGSWLFNKVEKSNLLRRSLKKFECIYVETIKLKLDLESIGFNNVVKMNNYKNIPIVKIKKRVKVKKILKLCTFSRVNYNKGIEDIIHAVNCLNEKAVKFELDIFGQIDMDYTEKFNDIIKNSKEYIKYQGIVDSNKSIECIQNYDLLVFPTRYYTEGIPGTIIDAYASGVPVIASRWQNCNDIVHNKKTGYIYDFKNDEDLKSKLIYVYKNQNEIAYMGKECIKEAEKYCNISALDILFTKIKGD